MTDELGMADEYVPVLVVGAGPVGICTALFLARHGVRSLLVEKRHDACGPHRMPGMQARTVELLRAAGVLPEIRALQVGDSYPCFEGGILHGDPFTGSDEAVVFQAPSPDDRAGQDGATVWFDTPLVSLQQDADGVSATVEAGGAGRRRRVRARYLVGADGARSHTRRLLGIRRTGGGVFHALSISFRAPELAGLLKEPMFVLSYATVRAALIGRSRLHGTDPWLAASIYHPERGESPADFTDQRCVEIIRAAAGRPDLDVQIVDKVAWEGAQLVADRFRAGRVFLAGDAAQVHPPAAGFGVHPGVHDARNLAWKLAAVLAGWGGDPLLDTYDTERRRAGCGPAGRSHIRSGHACAMGRVGPEPTGQPGSRAPHVWLERDGRRISVIDLFWDSFVLLTGPAGDPWVRAATELVAHTPIPLRVVQIGDDPRPGAPWLVHLRPLDQDWAGTYGVKPDGAVLVRPDAFVAWRSVDLDPHPGAVLAEILAHAVGHPTGA